MYGASASTSDSDVATSTTHTHWRERTSCQPTRRSASSAPGGTRSPRERGRTRVSKAAESTNASASIVNAQPAPSPSTSAVAIAGPTSSAMFHTIVLAALACWNSSSGTVCGTRPVKAGLKNACAVPNPASITTIAQIGAGPRKISTASSPCSTARTRSVTTITRWRSSRSAHTPPISTNSTSGSALAARTRPTSLGLPMSGHVQRERDEDDPVAERGRRPRAPQESELAVTEDGAQVVHDVGR
jgi:hypothetical protein